MTAPNIYLYCNYTTSFSEYQVNLIIFKNIFSLMEHFILYFILYTIKQIEGVYIMDKIIIDYIVKNVNLINNILEISIK